MNMNIINVFLFFTTENMMYFNSLNNPCRGLHIRFYKTYYIEHIPLCSFMCESHLETKPTVSLRADKSLTSDPIDSR